MAALLYRTGRAKLENRAGHRPSRDYGDRYRITLWTQGRCVCLFNGDDTVGCSAYCVVCERHSGFRPGCHADPEPALAFRHRRWGACLCAAILLRSTVVSAAQARIRSYSFRRRLSWNALVRDGTEGVLRRPRSRAAEAFVSRRKCVGVRLTNEYGI